MPTQTTDKKTQESHLCRVYGFYANLAHVKRFCPDYKNTKCNVYNHVCSIWEEDNQAHAQTFFLCNETPEKPRPSPFDPRIFEALARLPEPTPLERLTISPAAVRENPFEK